MSETNEVKNNSEETTQVVQKKKKWLIPVIGGAAVALLVVLSAVIVVIALTVSAPKRALKKQLDLGEKYLTELDYDNAILAYEEALRIDPNNEEAYLALAGIYETLAENCEEENLHQAEEYASKGMDIVREGLTHVESAALREKEGLFTTRQEEYDQKEQEMLIDQRKLSARENLFDLFFNQGYRVDPSNLWLPIKETTYEPDGTEGGYVISEYSKKGDHYFEVRTDYNPDGTPYEKRDYEYNSNGFLVSENVYYEDGNLFWNESYEYDENGNLKEIVNTSYWDSGLVTVERAVFEWHVDDADCGYREYRYDENGNLKNPDGLPYMRDIWIGDLTRGLIYDMIDANDYKYELIDEKTLKEDTGYLYTIGTYERLTDVFPEDEK